jgi:hypothetical protein
LPQALELLEQCDKALGSCDGLVKSQEDYIGEQEGVINLQAERISKLEADKNSLLKNPLLWFFVGAAVGGVSGLLLTR